MALFVRTIGIARARTKIGMANLAYNLTRYVSRQGRNDGKVAQKMPPHAEIDIRHQPRRP